jgi:hypothetical protein
MIAPGSWFMGSSGRGPLRRSGDSDLEYRFASTACGCLPGGSPGKVDAKGLFGSGRDNRGSVKRYPKSARGEEFIGRTRAFFPGS